MTSRIDRPRVLITRRMPGNWQEELEREGCDLVLPEGDADAPMPREEMLRKVRRCHGAISMLTEKWNAEAFDAAGPQFRTVANYAVGFNNVDLEEANRRGIYVTNTPDVLTAASADIAWGLLMMAARRLGPAEQNVRSGHFKGWGPNDFLGLDLENKTLGIVGPGRIGTAVAQRSRGWNMRVIYSHDEQKPAFEKATGGTRVPFEKLLKESDFLSLNVPLTEKTYHLIGENELGTMKRTAVLVNTSRGAVVDEQALVRALKERKIFAAGLDVYEKEPELAEGLAGLDNAALLPHIGSATFETRARMAEVAVENLVVSLDGRTPPNLVNREKSS